MQSLYGARAVDVAFDDPNLIADAGLVPVVALAEQIGLPELIVEHVSIVDAANSAGANPAAKVMSLLAGMVAGADSIEDVDRLRQTGNRFVFAEMRAPSTLGHVLEVVQPRARPAAERRAAGQLGRPGAAGRPAARRRPGGVRGHAIDPTPLTARCTATPSRVPRSGGTRARRRCTRCSPPCPPRSPGRCWPGSGCAGASPRTCAGPPGSWPKPWRWSARSPRPRRSWCGRTASSTPPTWSPPPPGTARSCR